MSSHNSGGIPPAPPGSPPGSPILDNRELEVWFRLMFLTRAFQFLRMFAR